MALLGLQRGRISTILSKATQRLYFLKLLKRAGVPQAQLLHFYAIVIRPILEYAAPVWHHLLTKSQTNQIEAIQKRALNIIFIYTLGMPYANSLFLGGLPTLAERREKLSRTFFHSLEEPTSFIIYSLLPTILLSSHV